MARAIGHLTNFFERQMEIYLVDDSAVVRRTLKKLISQMPEVVVSGEADSVATAIAGIRSVRPQAVLLDFYLLDGTAVDILHEFHNKMHAPLFIVLSDFDNELNRKLALEHGAKYFFSKSRDFNHALAVLVRMAKEAPADGQSD